MLGAVCGSVVFGSLLDAHCAVSILAVALLLIRLVDLVGTLLPNTTGQNIK